MIPILSLLFVLTISVLVTKVATIALTHTGLSREAARFQARSAFTGVGFTTTEAEKVVNHPVRRRLIMMLMMTGNAGIVSAMASLLLTFIGGHTAAGLGARILLLTAGVGGLWLLSRSTWLDRQLGRLMAWAMKRWTELDVRDYASLLHLSGDYLVTEMEVQPGDWMENQPLSELRLASEGIVVLGIQRSDGCYLGAPRGATLLKGHDVLILYGREGGLRRLDERRAGLGGDLEHHRAVAEQQEVQLQEESADPAKGQPVGSGPTE